MKPKMYGDPYRRLKAANLPKKQYRQIYGQIKGGQVNEAMRGLERLKEARAYRAQFPVKGAKKMSEVLMCRWIPTAERVPKAGVPVLVARRKTVLEPLVVEQGVRLPEGRWKTFGHKFQPENVPYWMPLPEPPEEGHA